MFCDNVSAFCFAAVPFVCPVSLAPLDDHYCSPELPTSYTCATLLSMQTHDTILRPVQYVHKSRRYLLSAGPQLFRSYLLVTCMNSLSFSACPPRVPRLHHLSESQLVSHRLRQTGHPNSSVCWTCLCVSLGQGSDIRTAHWGEKYLALDATILIAIAVASPHFVYG